MISGTSSGGTILFWIFEYISLTCISKLLLSNIFYPWNPFIEFDVDSNVLLCSTDSDSLSDMSYYRSILTRSVWIIPTFLLFEKHSSKDCSRRSLFWRASNGISNVELFSWKWLCLAFLLRACNFSVEISLEQRRSSSSSSWMTWQLFLLSGLRWCLINFLWKVKASNFLESWSISLRS